MTAKRRKIIAVLAVLAACVMLWLERERILSGHGEAWFWIAIAALVAILAAAEFAGVGTSDSSEK